MILPSMRLCKRPIDIIRAMMKRIFSMASMSIENKEKNIISNNQQMDIVMDRMEM